MANFVESVNEMIDLQNARAVVGIYGRVPDAVMLEEMGNALIDLEVKFRASSLDDRMALRPIFA